MVRFICDENHVIPFTNILLCREKRFYTRETRRGICISLLVKVPPLFSWLAEMIKLRKEVNYLSCIEEKEGLIDIWCICFSIIKSLLCSVLGNNYFQELLNHLTLDPSYNLESILNFTFYPILVIETGGGIKELFRPGFSKTWVWF